MATYIEVTPREFLDSIDRLAPWKRTMLTSFTEAGLKVYGVRCYLDRATRSQGFGISDTNELVCLHSNRGEQGQDLIRAAVVRGGRWGTCFDGYLSNLYCDNGFAIICLMGWKDEYAPVGWLYEVYGRPKVVEIRLTSAGLRWHQTGLSEGHGYRVGE